MRRAAAEHAATAICTTIHTHKCNCSVVAKDDDGHWSGVTFRLVRDKDRGWLIAEVLVLAVDERDGGRGHGTRLVNRVKRLVRRMAEREGGEPWILTQAENRDPARNFWARQGLQEGDAATALVRRMEEDLDQGETERTVAMFAHIDDSNEHCDPRHSERAARDAADADDTAPRRRSPRLSQTSAEPEEDPPPSAAAAMEAEAEAEAEAEVALLSGSQG